MRVFDDIFVEGDLIRGDSDGIFVEATSLWRHLPGVCKAYTCTLIFMRRPTAMHTGGVRHEQDAYVIPELRMRILDPMTREFLGSVPRSKNSRTDVSRAVRFVALQIRGNQLPRRELDTGALTYCPVP